MQAHEVADLAFRYVEEVFSTRNLDKDCYHDVVTYFHANQGQEPDFEVFLDLVWQYSKNKMDLQCIDMFIEYQYSEEPEFPTYDCFLNFTGQKFQELLEKFVDQCMDKLRGQPIFNDFKFTVKELQEFFMKNSVHPENFTLFANLTWDFVSTQMECILSDAYCAVDYRQGN